MSVYELGLHIESCSPSAVPSFSAASIHSCSASSKYICKRTADCPRVGIKILLCENGFDDNDLISIWLFIENRVSLQRQADYFISISEWNDSTLQHIATRRGTWRPSNAKLLMLFFVLLVVNRRLRRCRRPYIFENSICPTSNVKWIKRRCVTHLALKQFIHNSIHRSAIVGGNSIFAFRTTRFAGPKSIERRRLVLRIGKLGASFHFPIWFIKLDTASISVDARRLNWLGNWQCVRNQYHRSLRTEYYRILVGELGNDKKKSECLVQ